MRIAVIYISILLNCFSILFSQQDNYDFRTEDRIRIKEAFNISNEFGDKIWAGWDKIPFTILLITDSNEYLMNHPEPTPDFLNEGYDTILNSQIYKRPRVYQKNFLATFAAVSGKNTILMGTPENTGRKSIPWIIVGLHEHLHLMQYASNNYDRDLRSLDLAGSDSTGMWMLNYPFPYKDSLVVYEYNRLTSAAKEAAFCNPGEFNDKFNIYLNKRNKFKKMLNDKDYRYFSFQIWQEGIAMYTEAKFLELLSKEGYAAQEELHNVKDYVSYGEQYINTVNNIKETSTALKLNETKRVCFYYLGALEGFILDRKNENWRGKYFTDKFFIENYYNN